MPGPNLFDFSSRPGARKMNDQAQPQDDSTEFDNFDSAVATLEQDTQPNEANEWTGPRCEKCEAPLKFDVVTVCRKCGWYASLGTFVEVDPNWETEDESDTAVARAPRNRICASGSISCRNGVG